MTLTLHGITGCDTVKKARLWLGQRKIAYAFHDYKSAGIDAERLTRWADAVSWEMLPNRAGTTFKALPDEAKKDLTKDKAIALMLASPSMIKRPVLEGGGLLFVGFKPEVYAQAFAV